MQCVVETDKGKLRGVEEDGLAIFRGVPFAAAPVGELSYPCGNHDE